MSALLVLLVLLLLLYLQVPVVDIVRSWHLLCLLNVLNVLHVLRRRVLQRCACTWSAYRTVDTGCQTHAGRIVLLCQD